MMEDVTGLRVYWSRLAKETRGIRWRPRSVRWLLLIVFPLGFLISWPAYDQWSDYLWLTVIAMVACGLLLTRLGRPLVDTLPLWVILSVFLLGYYLKFYWMSWALMTGAPFPVPGFERLAQSPDLRLRVYQFTTMGFGVFCVAGFAFWRRWEFGARLLSEDATRLGTSAPIWPRLGTVLLSLLTVVMVGTGYAQYITGVAILGRPMVRLPFRLAGVIFYARTLAVPMLLLLVVWLSMRRRSWVAVVLALLMLMCHGLSQMVLSSSRGSLIDMVIPLVFLPILESGKARREVVLIIAAVATAFAVSSLLHPVISRYRLVRASGDPRDITGALSQALESPIEPEEPSEPIRPYPPSYRPGGRATLPALVMSYGARGVQSILARVVGAEHMLYVVQEPDTPPSQDKLRHYLADSDARPLTLVYTHEVMGIPRSQPTSGAPSLVGAFYLLGGSIGVCAGVTLWTALWALVWGLGQRLNLCTRPVAQSMLLQMLLRWTSEGDIDTIPLRGSLLLACVLLCEVLVRASVWRGSRCGEPTDASPT